MEKLPQSHVLNCEDWPLAKSQMVGIEAVFLLEREVSSGVSLNAFGGKTLITACFFLMFNLKALLPKLCRKLRLFQRQDRQYLFSLSLPIFCYSFIVNHSILATHSTILCY